MSEHQTVHFFMCVCSEKQLNATGTFRMVMGSQDHRALRGRPDCHPIIHSVCLRKKTSGFFSDNRLLHVKRMQSHKHKSFYSNNFHVVICVSSKLRGPRECVTNFLGWFTEWLTVKNGPNTLKSHTSSQPLHTLISAQFGAGRPLLANTLDSWSVFHHITVLWLTETKAVNLPLFSFLPSPASASPTPPFPFAPSISPRFSYFVSRSHSLSLSISCGLSLTLFLSPSLVSPHRSLAFWCHIPEVSELPGQRTLKAEPADSRPPEKIFFIPSSSSSVGR